MRGPDFIKLGENIGRYYCIFVSEFGYLAAFSNAGGSDLSDAENYANVALFDPSKIRGGVGEIFIPIVNALPTTEPTECDGHPRGHNRKK